jgi:hypothetical protein
VFIVASLSHPRVLSERLIGDNISTHEQVTAICSDIGIVSMERLSGKAKLRGNRVDLAPGIEEGLAIQPYSPHFLCGDATKRKK